MNNLNCKSLFLKTIILSPAFSFMMSGQNGVIRQPNGSLKLEKIPGTSPRNVIFILTDDQRFDGLGFLGAQPFIRTPNLDRLAQGGAYLPNAFCTTSLSCPSRASILTGLYAHNHKVMLNEESIPEDVIFFPQYLQQAGYVTALVGKWHIGMDTDDPQRGFDYWVSFKGQGSYLPEKNGLNVNGKHVEQKGYITDELTDYALEFLKNRNKKKPFMLYMGHKGVHLPMLPAERHKGIFKDYDFTPPITSMTGTHQGAPMWVQNRRNSRHGIEYPFETKEDVEVYYKRYAETLCSVDESVGRILDYLKENGLLESTLVIFMSDNGVHFGDHGFVDKRSAYEESMRVPLLAYCPELIKPGTVVKEMVANIDIAETVLEAAGLKAPDYMNGKSFLPLLQGKQVPWRDALIYEYFWERNFPMTPTMHALRTERYKYIRYYGLWDTDELYDLQSDPLEKQNLIRSEAHQEIAVQMNNDLFEDLKNTNGMYIQLYPDKRNPIDEKGNPIIWRYEFGSPAAEFPSYIKREK